MHHAVNITVRGPRWHNLATNEANSKTCGLGWNSLNSPLPTSITQRCKGAPAPAVANLLNWKRKQMPSHFVEPPTVNHTQVSLGPSNHLLCCGPRNVIENTYIL